MNQKLTISFINVDTFSIKQWTWISVILLGFSLMMFVQMGVVYFKHQQALTELQEKFARKQMTRVQKDHASIQHKMPVSEIKLSITQKKQINETISELVVDWDSLFQTIENTLLEEIAILEISPNSKKKLIVIRGEAKTLKAVFAYIKSLDDTANLSKVYLQTHSVDEANVSKPVSFTVSAEWQRHSSFEEQP